jgi:hypothetical protein
MISAILIDFQLFHFLTRAYHQYGVGFVPGFVNYKLEAPRSL